MHLMLSLTLLTAVSHSCSVIPLSVVSPSVPLMYSLSSPFDNGVADLLSAVQNME